MQQEALIVRPILPPPLLATPGPAPPGVDPRRPVDGKRPPPVDERVHACLYFIAPTGHGYCVYIVMYSLYIKFVFTFLQIG